MDPVHRSADSAYKQPLCQPPIEAERVTGAANGPVKLGHVGRAGALSGRCGARIFAFSPEMLAYCVSSQDPPGAARWLGGREVHRRGQSDRSSWGGARLECAGPTDSPSPPVSLTSQGPPVATERLSLSESGHVRDALKTPYSDGTTHVIFEPEGLVFTIFSRGNSLTTKTRAA